MNDRILAIEKDLLLVRRELELLDRDTRENRLTAQEVARRQASILTRQELLEGQLKEIKKSDGPIASVTALIREFGALKSVGYILAIAVAIVLIWTFVVDGVVGRVLDIWEAGR